MKFRCLISFFFFSFYSKQFIEVLLLSCPPPLYSTHLAPIIGPIFEHIQYRLEKTWNPIMNSLSSKPLFTEDCAAAAIAAGQNTEAWYTSYYARSGLFVGSLDSETAEAAVEVAAGAALLSILSCARPSY